MLCEGDLTDSEFRALEQLCRSQRTVMLVLNKSDRYTRTELEALLQRLEERCQGLLPAQRIVSASAAPRPKTVIQIDESGKVVSTEVVRTSHAFDELSEDALRDWEFNAGAFGGGPVKTRAYFVFSFRAPLTAR